MTEKRTNGEWASVHIALLQLKSYSPIPGAFLLAINQILAATLVHYQTYLELCQAQIEQLPKDLPRTNENNLAIHNQVLLNLNEFESELTFEKLSPEILPTIVMPAGTAHLIESIIANE